ncbi:MAG TPA: hypothetical protein VF458_21370 [Ktedonobacteraceae bacterium]
MFSVFKQASGTHEGVLKELSDEQLSEVAGGQHHHHHKHHKPTTKPPVTMPPVTMPPTGTQTPGSPVTVGGVTYPSNSHW